MKEIKNVCEKCKELWIQRKAGRPVRCPRCSSLSWDVIDPTYGDQIKRETRISKR